MTWLGLDALVRPLKPLVARLPPNAPLREAGAAVVGAHYGDALVEHPALVNVGVLAVISGGQPPVWHCRPSASRVVHETDLRSIPSEPPPILRGAGIIEARRPETGERLWGNVASIGWYAIDGREMYPPRLLPAIFLVAVQYPDGIAVARWCPAWTGEDLVEQLPYQETNTSLIEAVEAHAHHELAKQAARYLVIFGLLEQVEDGPLRFEVDKTTRVRHVRVKDLSAKGFREPPKSAVSLGPSVVDGDARALAETIVRGHLKRVRTGAGRSRVEWRYVHEHGARRWFAPRWTVERDHRHSGLANASIVYRGSKP